jgi:hypothetical protein
VIVRLSYGTALQHAASLARVLAFRGGLGCQSKHLDLCGVLTKMFASFEVGTGIRLTSVKLYTIGSRDSHIMLTYLIEPPVMYGIEKREG